MHTDSIHDILLKLHSSEAVYTTMYHVEDTSYEGYFVNILKQNISGENISSEKFPILK